MQRWFAYALGIGLGLLIIWRFPLVQKRINVEKESEAILMAPTLAHKALEQEYGWLNVSWPLRAGELSGRILLLDFWTFCCINCLHIIPDLHKLEAEFGDQLTVIGVHSGKFFNERDEENIRAAVLRHDIEHPVVNDANFRIWKSFGVRAWPTLVLINPRGTLEKVYSGEGHLEELRRDIQALLQEYGTSVKTEKLPIALEKTKERPSFLRFPGKIIFAPEQNLLFISDAQNNRIVGATLEGEVKLLIGSGRAGKKDASFNEAEFRWPQGLLYYNDALYVADTENHLLRKIDFDTKKVSTIAGTGKQGFGRITRDISPLNTSISSPWDLTLSADGRDIIIAMAGLHQLWAYSFEKNMLWLVAGNGIESIDDGKYPANSLSQPSGISRFENKIYFVDSETSSLRVLEGENIETLIGTGLFDFGFQDGVGKKAQMQHPLGVFADASGVYIADSYNHAIRHFDPATRMLTTLAGKGEPGFAEGKSKQAKFFEPNGLTKVGNRLYIADTNNHQIRVFDFLTREVSTLSLMMPYQESLSENLPNVESAEVFIYAETEIPFQVKLLPGWKLNEQAPSFFALYDEKGKLMKKFSHDELSSGKASLPALVSGKNYRLQGTLYYCEAKESSRCLVTSRDIKLRVAATGQKDLVIAIDFSNPAH